MIAIRISNKIKKQNPVKWVQNAEIGDIIVKTEVPNRFFVTENIVGGYKGRADLHSVDGWRPFILTPFDATAQKQTRNIVKVEDVDGNITHYTFKIKDLSQQEQNEELENKEESEAGEKMAEHIDKGRALFEKCYRKIWRRRNKDSDALNKLTQAEERELMRLFSGVFQWLNLGNFHQAKREISKVISDNQTELDLVAGMINTAVWFETEILDYFNNSYDL